MDENFKFRATTKSDEELYECIDNREKYLPESVEAAVEELQIRGAKFTEEELMVIAEDMQARRDLAAEGQTSFGMLNNGEKDLQIEDPDALYLFSKRAILVFSVLFSVAFASVLMAINVSKTPHRGKAGWVVLFGFGFTTVVAVLAQYLNLSSAFSVLTGFGGAYLLDLLFWNKYIGNTTLYRLRPVWGALLIAIAIVIPLVFFLIKYGKV
jgi:hypothetical protein